MPAPPKPRRTLVSRVRSAWGALRAEGDPTDMRYYTDPGSGFMYPAPSRATAGMNVNPDTALTIGAVFRAVRLLADDVAQLPLQFFVKESERAGGLPGGKRRVENDLADVIAFRPNDWQTSFEFRQMMTAHLLLRGNARARIRFGTARVIDALVPLNPARTRTVFTDSGRVLHIHRTKAGREEKLAADEVFHLRGVATDPDSPEGLSPVGVARTSIGLTMATEQFGAREFSQRPRPSFLLEHPQRLDKETSERISRSFVAATSGPDGWNFPPVLEENMKATPVGMNHDDAQFLETRQFQITEVARWFGVPPHMIGDLTKSSFSNIEQQSIDYVVHSLLPWLVLWEQSIARDLVTDASFPQFNVDGLLRGEAAARAQAFQLYINMRAMTPNEVRALLNMNPVPWGDEPAMPQGAPAPMSARPSPERDEPKSDEPFANRLPKPLNGSRAHA